MLRKTVSIFLLLLILSLSVIAHAEENVSSKERPWEQQGFAQFPPNVIMGKHFALQAAKLNLCAHLMSYRYRNDDFYNGGHYVVSTMEHNEKTPLLFGVSVHEKEFVLNEGILECVVTGAVHIMHNKGKQEQFGPPKWTNTALTAPSYPKVSLLSNDPEIAALEQKIDIYDTQNAISVDEARKIANQILKKDKRNATAFRCITACWISKGRVDKAMEMCKKVLGREPSSLLAMEAYNQMCDIYLDEMTEGNHWRDARSSMEKGIALARKYYSSIEIESLVNGTDFRIVELKPVGTSNTVRELYVKKFEIEGVAPYFKYHVHVFDPNSSDDVVMENFCFRTSTDFFY